MRQRLFNYLFDWLLHPKNFYTRWCLKCYCLSDYQQHTPDKRTTPNLAHIWTQSSPTTYYLLYWLKHFSTMKITYPSFRLLLLWLIQLAIRCFGSWFWARFRKSPATSASSSPPTSFPTLRAFWIQNGTIIPCTVAYSLASLLPFRFNFQCIHYIFWIALYTNSCWRILLVNWLVARGWRKFGRKAGIHRHVALRCWIIRLNVHSISTCLLSWQ